MSERFALRYISKAAEKEFRALDGATRAMVAKGLARLRVHGDEIGKPLGGALQGCRELKFRADGIRIIYRIAAGCIEVIEVIAIGKRDKGRVFDVAARRVEEQDAPAGAEGVGEDG